jgi:hypothetical protein
MKSTFYATGPLLKLFSHKKAFKSYLGPGLAVIAIILWQVIAAYIAFLAAKGFWHLWLYL